MYFGKTAKIHNDGKIAEIDFYIHSTRFQSYQDDGRMIMKGCVH